MLHKLLPRRLPLQRLLFRFADDKEQGKAPEEDNKGMQNETESDKRMKLKRRFVGQVKIEQKFHDKTSALYDRYMQVREKPIVCHDGLLLAYQFIIERLPIFVPYQQKNFQLNRNRYVYAKKTGFYVDLPKDLRIEHGDNPFQNYEQSNHENAISHQIVLSPTEKISYRQNSRVWRFTDPTITDPHSIQTHSSDHVFFIVKEKGQWKFPTKLINQKDSHTHIFYNMTEHLFQATKYPVVHYPTLKPLGIRKTNMDGYDKQVRLMTFKGISTYGIPKFPTSIYEDFAWVPKPHLAKYFADSYFEESIWSITHAAF